MDELVARVRGFPAPSGRLDFVLQKGDIVLLCGRNGSGKTSILRNLAGLEAPLQADRVEVDGRQPADFAAQGLPQQLSFAPQEPLDGLVGLTVAGEFRLRDRAMPSGLLDLAERDVANLSSGQARRVALKVASTDAPLLLLDEPADGLDAARCNELRQLVLDHAAHGAVVLADHTGLLGSLATRIVALDTATTLHIPPSIPQGSATVIEASTCRMRRGGLELTLPALRLPSGLHAVAGPNASGKSSLLLRLAGLLDSTGVTIAGTAPSAGHNVRLLLPRAGDLFLHEDVVAELRGLDLDIVQALVPQILLERHPLSLSAGEAQRVALAKTFGRPAALYLLDEPEAHLDAEGRDVLWRLLAQRAGEGSCLLVATHDPALLAASGTTLRLGGAA